MAPFQDMPLVGPGTELQLTIDGRAVPHADVVASSAAPAAPSSTSPPTAVPDPTDGLDGDAQTSLSDL